MPDPELMEALGAIEWTYGFWGALSPYAYARAEDNVVILPPNQVYKTNATGVKILGHLSAGGRFEDIPGMTTERVGQIESFFVSLRSAYEGHALALERVPYGFDFTRLPVLGEIALTYRCNNRCRFCYAGCGNPELEGKVTGGVELDTDGFKRVIDIFRDHARIPFFSFTGGEPLIRQDVEELARYAVSRGLRVNLVTNGRLATPARAASLCASGITTAQVSLEAPDDATHTALCGATGSFAETVAGIQAMQAAGISVQTNSTLTRFNRDALLDLPEFVAGLGVRRMSMNLFIPVGSGEGDAGLYIPYGSAGAFIDEVRKRAHSAGVEFFWYSPIPLCIYNTMARGLGNKSCAACDGLVSVSPSGDVLPCSSWPEPVGNLLSDGFEAIWFSDRASWIKNKNYAPDSCVSCGSFSACQAACPLYWRSMGYEELHHARNGRAQAVTGSRLHPVADR